MTVVGQLKISAVPRTRLSDSIVRQLENLILNKELRVGDALPPEREAAAQLQVSRNVVREAISVLVQKGLLEVRQGSGTYVARPGADFLRESLDSYVRFSDSALYDLAEARSVLEVQIAGLAAQRATREDYEFVNACLQELEATVGDPDRYVEADVSFHAALAEAAGNEILQLLLHSIRGALRQNIRVLVENDPTTADTAMRFHRRIAQAVHEQSPEKARAAMLEHLESVRQSLGELEALEPKTQ